MRPYYYFLFLLLSIYINQITGDLKKVVDAIDLILTNQRNDFLIQQEGKTRQPKDKLYAEIRCQISPHAIREIHKQIERSLDAIDKKVQLSPCTTSFRETMQLPCAHELDWLMYQEKPIPIKIFIGIGGLLVALIGTLEETIVMRNQNQLLHFNVQAQQQINTPPRHLKTAFHPSLLFCQKMFPYQEIFIKMRVVMILAFRIQNQVLGSIFQGLTISLRMLLLNLETTHQKPLPIQLYFRWTPALRKLKNHWLLNLVDGLPAH